MNSTSWSPFRPAAVALRLGYLMLIAAPLVAGCQSLSYLDDPGADGGADAGTGSDGGLDGGPGACADPNPAGCSVRGCPADQICDLGVSRCLPSECSCDAATGAWICTDDCGGGLCRPGLPSGEITFVLSFDSDVPQEDGIFVQASDSSGGPAWIEVIDPLTAEPIRTLPICSCACDACGESCPVCGAAPDIVERLAAGEEVTYTWDAITHPLGTCANGWSCWGSEVLSHGRYLARFCYSASATGEGMGHRIDAPLCDDIPFEWLGTRTFVSNEVCWCG